MKKNLLIIVSVSILTCLLVVAGVCANSGYIAFKEPQNEFEENIKNEIDAKQLKFKTDVYLDVSSSFGIDLDEYTEIDPFSEEDTKYETLSEILFDTMKSQSFGDIRPYAYISKRNPNECIILEKKQDGTNYMYTLKFDKVWSNVKTDSNEGKVFSEFD